MLRLIIILSLVAGSDNKRDILIKAFLTKAVALMKRRQPVTSEG